ncbi:MAG: 5'-nucleotidase C-terminal domain-containing protein [Muribaculaceae bacterium]|nr:5'-nucleotidase C-terminal domain-containing protein [Muribaculaceae bacterium]
MINPSSQANNIKTSIFYINDYHGKSINMERTITASNAFDAQNKNKKDVDTFKLSSGDIMIGEDFKTNQLAVMFQKVMGITASAVGNHEYDMQDKANMILPLINYKLLASNVKINPRNHWSNKIHPSVIEERNGHKYGIIGTSPIDLFTRSKQGIIQRDINVSKSKETIEDIQHEVNKLQQKGIDKIILLSHLGYTMDKIVANQTQGIDVILGGHSHDLIKDVKEGKNLFYSQTGEPVVITQAGRDGKNFGILNLEFDQNGIIKKVQNNVGDTRDFRRYAPIKYVFDKIFGARETYGHINSAPPPLKKDLIEPNPHAYFIADCIRKDLDCDLAILPSPNVRGYFEHGKIDSRILADILPFQNKLYKVKYSEKEIVDAIKLAAKSFTNVANKPGIFYVSGLEYSVTTNGQIKSMSYVDRSGKKTPININNPRNDKFYVTVLNDYCAQGNDGFQILNHPERILKKYPFDATQCIKNILSKTDKPIDIVDDGRIEVIKE